MAFPKKTPKTSPPQSSPLPAPQASPPPGAAPQRSEVKGSGTTKAPVAIREITWQAIERRAYEIYASRGYAQGDQNADWLEAERQLKAGL